MNSLEGFCLKNNLDRVFTMNLLQNNGIVSDNCVNLEDVAESDCMKAIAFLLYPAE